MMPALGLASPAKPVLSAGCSCVLELTWSPALLGDNAAETKMMLYKQR